MIIVASLVGVQDMENQIVGSGSLVSGGDAGIARADGKAVAAVLRCRVGSDEFPRRSTQQAEVVVHSRRQEVGCLGKEALGRAEQDDGVQRG